MRDFLAKHESMKYLYVCLVGVGGKVDRRGLGMIVGMGVVILGSFWYCTF